MLRLNEYVKVLWQAGKGIQIQPMLRLNTGRISVFGFNGRYSNTTNVKVKPPAVSTTAAAQTNSNTTNVKVKLQRCIHLKKCANYHSNTTNVKVKQEFRVFLILIIGNSNTTNVKVKPMCICAMPFFVMHSNTTNVKVKLRI